MADKIWVEIDKEGNCTGSKWSSPAELIPDNYDEDSWVEVTEDFDLGVKKTWDGTNWSVPPYYESREAVYPGIGEQLDDLFRQGAFSVTMTETLQAIKDKFPKA